MTEQKVVSLYELINPFPRQHEFLEAVQGHIFTLYGGAAGGGKSRILRWTLLALLIEWYRAHGIQGIRVGLFCEDYPALEDRQISKIRREFPKWMGTLNESRHEFILKPEFGEGVICFRNLDDTAKYQSAEFAAIAVDELTKNEEGVFNDLRARLRWPGISDTKFLGATNPGSVGHLWVKRIWIDQDLPPHLAKVYKQSDFAYVRALATDNPYNDASYLQQLDSLPPNLRRAFLEGDWDAFEGQVFQEFRLDVHTMDPIAIPEWWAKWVANDPGYSDPGIWYCMAADQDGFVYVYREITFDNRTTHSEQARAVLERLTHRQKLPGGKESVDLERYDFIVTGMDAFVQDPDSKKAPVDFYREGGLDNFIEPDHGAGCRVRRAQIVHEYLRPFEKEYEEDGQKRKKTISRVRIFNTCRRLITTLPALPADEKNPEQVKECSADHWYDALGYGLQAWHTERSKLPARPLYKKGSYGDLLAHEKVWNPGTGSGRNLLAKGIK